MIIYKQLLFLTGTIKKTKSVFKNLFIYLTIYHIKSTQIEPIKQQRHNK